MNYIVDLAKWKSLSPDGQKILTDLYANGADCAKFLARRHGKELGEMMNLLKELEKDGWISRVKGTFLSKRTFVKPKHMNHTYYTITRKTKLLLRDIFHAKKRRKEIGAKK